MNKASGKTNTANNTISPRNAQIFTLLLLADGHVKLVAGILGVSQPALSIRLRGKTLKDQWLSYRRIQKKIRRKAALRRVWWRWRLRGMGIDPLSIREGEPLYWIVNFRRRGYFVDVVAREMREETPSRDLSTPEAIDELINRADAFRSATLAADKAVTGDVTPPDDVDGDDVDDDGDGDGYADDSDGEDDEAPRE